MEMITFQQSQQTDGRLPTTANDTSFNYVQTWPYTYNWCSCGHSGDSVGGMIDAFLALSDGDKVLVKRLLGELHKSKEKRAARK